MISKLEPEWHDRQSRREYFEQYREKALSARLPTLKIEGSGVSSFIHWCAQLLEQKAKNKTGLPADFSAWVDCLGNNAETLKTLLHGIHYGLSSEQATELQEQMEECMTGIRECTNLIDQVDLRTTLGLSKKEGKILQLIPSRLDFLEDILQILF